MLFSPTACASVASGHHVQCLQNDGTAICFGPYIILPNQQCHSPAQSPCFHLHHFRETRPILTSLHMGLHAHTCFDFVCCVSVWECAHEQVSVDTRGV